MELTARQRAWKRYYAKHREVLIERAKKYNKENNVRLKLTRKREWNQKYYWKNRDTLLLKGGEYRLNNKEKITESHKAYYKNNRRKILKSQNAYYHRKGKVFRQEGYSGQGRKDKKGLSWVAFNKLFAEAG